MKVQVAIDGTQTPLDGLPADRSKVAQGLVKSIAAFPEGMKSGGTSVAVVGVTTEGKSVFLEMSLRVFQIAAAGFTGRYGDETGSAAFTVGPNGAEVVWSPEKPKT